MEIWMPVLDLFYAAFLLILLEPKPNLTDFGFGLA